MMKFVKGMMVGGMITTGMAFLYLEMNNQTKRKIMKKGKQAIKKMGIV